MLCAATLIVAGTALVRGVDARADQSPAWQGPFGATVANADLARRCPADVIVIVDLAAVAATPAEHRAALRSGLATLLGATAERGARSALVAFGADAELVGSPAEDPFVAPDATTQGADAKAAEARLDALLERAGAADPAASNWEAGLRRGYETAAHTPAERSLVVVHVGSAAPSRRLIDGKATPTADPAADATAAAAAADLLRSRPSTHLYGVAVAASEADLAGTWPAISGPDVFAAGTRPIAGASDDLLTVAGWPDLPAALGSLSESFCATNVGLSVLAGVGGDQPAPSAPVALVPADDAATMVSLAATTSAAQTTDAAGRATWTLRASTPAPFNVELDDGTHSGDERGLAICSDHRGVLASHRSEGGAIILEGLLPGADVRCELRLREAAPAAPPLVLRHTATADGQATCTGDGAGDKAGAAIGVVGQRVDHCLAVTNTSTTALRAVKVEAPELGLGGDSAWLLANPLGPGATLSRHVERTIVTVQDIEAVASADAPGSQLGARIRASATVAHQVLPPDLAVVRSLTSEGPAACGTATPHLAGGQSAGYCYVVSNRGGTVLDAISIDDPAVAAEPIGSPRPLGPGESATITGVATLLGESGGEAVATARAADANGDVLVDVVSSQVDPNLSGLTAHEQLSALAVPEGADVTTTVTVTNTGTKPLESVSVRSTMCGDETATDQRVADDGDAQLERGEAWIYVCTRAIVEETVAMSLVTAQDSGSTSTQPQRVRLERANLKMKKKQINDLRIGKPTTYLLEVDNNGNLAAPNVVVTDPLDATVTLVSATPNVGSCSLGDANTVTCSLGDIPAETNGRHTITLVVMAQPAGLGKTVENRAQVSSSIGDFNPLDNAYSAYGQVFAADQCTASSRDCTPTTASESTQTTATGSDETIPLRAGATPVGVTPAIGIDPRLASTGADSLALATWACLLVASGLGLLALARRRRALSPPVGVVAV